MSVLCLQPDITVHVSFTQTAIKSFYDIISFEYQQL